MKRCRGESCGISHCAKQFFFQTAALPTILAHTLPLYIHTCTDAYGVYFTRRVDLGENSKQILNIFLFIYNKLSFSIIFCWCEMSWSEMSIFYSVTIYSYSSHYFILKIIFELLIEYWEYFILNFQNVQLKSKNRFENFMTFKTDF